MKTTTTNQLDPTLFPSDFDWANHFAHCAAKRQAEYDAKHPDMPVDRNGNKAVRLHRRIRRDHSGLHMNGCQAAPVPKHSNWR